MKSHIILLAAAIVVAACTSRQESSVPTIKVEPMTLKNSPDEVFESCKVIILDSTRKALLSNPQKIISTDDYYFISDNWKQIKVFDKEGRFVSEVNRVGRSGQEYLNVTNFDVVGNTIYVLSRGNQKLYEYDIRGKYINSYELDDWYEEALMVDSHKALLFSNNSNNKMKNYVLFDLKQGKSVAECDDFSVNASLSIGHMHLTRNDGNILTSKVFDYNIYQYDNNAIKPILQLSFDTKDVLPEDADIRVIAEKTENKNVVRYFDSFTKVGNKVFVSYNLKSGLPFGFQYLTAANLQDSTSITINLGLQNCERFPLGFGNGVLFGDALYSLFSPTSYNSRIGNSAKHIDEEANYVLLEYKLKH